MRQHFLHSKLSVLVLAALAVPAFANDVAANEADTELGEVVVTATGTAQRIKEAPASITVVTAQELQEKSHSNLAEALSGIPGVDIRNGVNKTGGLNVQLRGMPADYTLVLIDGRRQNTSGSITPNGVGDTAIGSMPPVSQIQRIEVIRGPMSTLYGSDAMGGVINIITKPISSGEWGGNIAAETLWHQHEGGNTRQIGFSTSGPIVQDKIGIQLRGKYFDRGDAERMMTQGTGRDPRPGESESYDIGTKLSFNLNENHELWLDLNRSRQRYSNEDNRMGTLDKPNLPAARPGLSADDRASGYKDAIVSIKNQYALGHTSEFEVGTWKSYVMQVEAETRGRTMPYGWTTKDDSYRFNGEDRTLTNKDLTVNTQFQTQLGNHNVVIGAEYSDNETVDLAAGKDVKFTQDSWAVFLEDQWKILPNLGLTVGGRYQDHSSFGGHFTPRAYLVWNTTDRLTLKGGVSTGYKVPTSNSLHSGINGWSGQGRTVTVGSPHLKPEKSTNFELSANYATERFDVTGTAFLNKFKNKIESKTVDNCVVNNTPNCYSLADFPAQATIGQSYNVGEAETKGFELSSRVNLTQDWYLKGAYTWMKTEITSGESQGQELVSAPRHALNLHTGYNVNERWKVWFEGEYKADRNRFQGDQKDQSAANQAVWDATGNKLKGYTVFNLGSSYRFTDSLKVSASINNLFDRKFDETAKYTFNGQPEEAYMYSHASQSIAGTFIERRNLWLSVSYDF